MRSGEDLLTLGLVPQRSAWSVEAFGKALGGRPGERCRLRRWKRQAADRLLEGEAKQKFLAFCARLVLLVFHPRNVKDFLDLASWSSPILMHGFRPPLNPQKVHHKDAGRRSNQRAGSGFAFICLIVDSSAGLS